MSIDSFESSGSLGNVSHEDNQAIARLQLTGQAQVHERLLGRRDEDLKAAADKLAVTDTERFVFSPVCSLPVEASTVSEVNRRASPHGVARSFRALHPKADLG